MPRIIGPKNDLIQLGEIGMVAIGGSVVEGGVEALGIVVAVDEREDFGMGICGVDEAAILQHLSFERAHERFALGVVIGSCRQALTHSREPQEVTIGSTAVLATLVAA